MQKKSQRTKNIDKFSTRLAIWRHNSFFGHARMMEAQAQAIMNAPSVTDEAKGTAGQIQLLARTLRTQLKERVKP